MLVTPDVVVKPNILFMLDTSGSMDDEVSTKRPYDPAEIYGGTANDCDSNAIYWSDVDLIPSCTTNQHIPKSAFQCSAADGRLMGIGSYSDTMVQFRETVDPAIDRWQELDAGNDSMVECMADSGEHGAGVAGEVYATNNGAQTGFTSDSTQELAWGSAPATVTYTVYDGNYLNWKNSTVTEDVRKIDILKAVTKAVLNSISDVNVGIMRFNGNDGGLVIKAMSDLDVDRASILATVDGLPAQGNTPLAEMMYEAALYWRGELALFGNGHLQTDPMAVDGAGNYIPPPTPVCTKNYNVLLSDGQPNDTNDQTPTLVANLPEFLGSCDDSGVGACLDDIAQNLATVTIDGVMEDDQLVTTHTIGFALDIPSLQRTADDAGGRYFRADDVETLTTALLQIFSDITKRSLSFTAPSVSVNSFNRTQNLNDLYLAVFSAKGNVHWPGNVKKYRIADGEIVDATDQPAVDPGSGFFHEDAQSLWSDSVDGFDVVAGGAAHELPDPGLRQLFTNNGTGGALVAVSSTTVTDAELGLTGAAGEPSLQQLVDWMHGVDIRDENLDQAITDTRFAMGDPLHSQPAAVVYGGDAAGPDVVVFAGTNDGYLHAIDGDTGAELWAFVPTELLGDMNRLFFDPSSTFKHYGIDGSIVPVVFDDDNDGTIEAGEGDFVYILFGLRRGGNSYYALDVTNKNAPEMLWVKQYPEFGQSWSTPVVALVDTDDVDVPDDETQNAVVIVGGGYDPVHDTPAYPTSVVDAQGAGIHMLDLGTGDRLWWAGPANSGADLEIDDMTRAIPTQVRVIDMSGDGLADRMYAADIGGQIWRFDITNGSDPLNLVEGGVIARLGAEGTGDAPDNPRRFYNSPDVAIFNDPVQGRRFISISIGSGYRAHPLNTAAPDTFFSVRDPDVFNQLSETAYANYDAATVDDLEMVTPGTPATVGPEDRGWKFQLPDGQAVLADSVTFADSVFIVAFAPDENTINACQPSTGLNFLYQVSVANGDFAVNNLDSPVDDEATAYVTEIGQGGIAPSATVLFPGSTNPDCEGAECTEPPIFCVGPECFDPGFKNDPVRTLWTQDGIE
jgi:type IV pilus assembly protein PilY1